MPTSSSFVANTYHLFYSPRENPQPREPETYLWDKLYNDIDYLADIPFDLSKQRYVLGSLNMQRLSTRFTMLTLKQLLLLVSQNHMLDSLQWLLGRPVNIAILESPLGVYNALSVALFGLRFIVNMTDILQHTLTQTEGELNLPWDKRIELMRDRFYAGLIKHHYQLANDLVWGIVNALCNYSDYFHIPAGVPNYLMVGFTVFDLTMLMLELYLVNKKYNQERSLISDQNEIDRLDLEYEKNSAELQFYIVGACLLLIMFAVGFLLLPEAYLPVCLMVCNVCFAMYLSGDKYGLLQQAVKQDEMNGITIVSEEVKMARYNLGFTMAKNTIAPFVIMAAYTINLPAAIALTVAYMAYEHGYLMRLPELVMPRQEEAAAPTP